MILGEICDIYVFFYKKNFYKKTSLNVQPRHELSLTKSVELIISHHFYREFKKILRKSQPFFADFLRNPRLSRKKAFLKKKTCIGRALNQTLRF